MFSVYRIYTYLIYYKWFRPKEGFCCTADLELREILNRFSVWCHTPKSVFKKWGKTKPQTWLQVCVYIYIPHTGTIPAAEISKQHIGSIFQLLSENCDRTISETHLSFTALPLPALEKGTAALITLFVILGWCSWVGLNYSHFLFISHDFSAGIFCCMRRNTLWG